MPKPNEGLARLRLFDDAGEARDRARTTGADIQVVVYGTYIYLKRPGRPRVEPRYLCKDGHWRKWDNVAELAAME